MSYNRRAKQGRAHLDEQRPQADEDLVASGVPGMMEQLADHRGFVRLEVLERLQKLLETYDPDAISEWFEELVENVFRGPLKRGDEAEVKLACNVLGRIFVTEGGVNESVNDLWRKSEGHLFNKENPDALQAAGLVAFIGTENDAETLEVMSKMENYFKKKDYAEEIPQVAAAIRAWSLLATTMEESTLIEYITGPVGAPGALALRHLSSKDIQGKKMAEVKLAATAALRIVLDTEPTEMEEVELEGAPFPRNPWDEKQDYSAIKEAHPEASTDGKKLEMESLSQALDNVAEDTATAKSRVPAKSRGWRKQLALESDPDAEFIEVVKLKNGEAVEITGFAGKRRLEEFRGVLGSGFTDHLAFNPLLRGVFDLGLPEDHVGKIPKDKRAYARKDRERTRHMKNRRREVEDAETQI